MRATTSGPDHESIGVVSSVVVAGKPRLPVGAQRPERIPSLAAPSLGNPPLQYDVPDAAQAQAGAHRQAGLPGPDDDAVEDLHVIHFLSLR